MWSKIGHRSPNKEQLLIGRKSNKEARANMKKSWSRWKCCPHVVQLQRKVVTTVFTVMALAIVAPVVTAQSSLTLQGGVSGEFSANALAIHGDLLAVATGSTVHLVDVSRPDAAVIVGEHDFADSVLGLVMEQGVAFVANGHEGFQRLDVSNPSEPVVTGMSATRGQAVGVAVSGAHAFVADNSIGFDVVRTTGEVTAVGEYLADGFPRGIGAAGDFVFLADQPAGLIVIDVTQPASPTPVGQLALSGARARVIVPQGTTGSVAPPIVCVTAGAAGPGQPGYQGSGGTRNSEGSSYLQVVDVSDPTAPVIAAPIPTSEQPRGIVLHGEHAFVVSAGMLEIFDVSEPSQPTRTASQRVGSGANALAVNDESVFVATDDGISIFARP